MKDEGGRAIIYRLGKRRGAVPARFPQCGGVPNPTRQTPESALSRRKGSGRIHRMDQQGRTTIWSEISFGPRISRGLR